MLRHPTSTYRRINEQETCCSKARSVRLLAVGAFAALLTGVSARPRRPPPRVNSPTSCNVRSATRQRRAAFTRVRRAAKSTSAPPKCRPRKRSRCRVASTTKPLKALPRRERANAFVHAADRPWRPVRNHRPELAAELAAGDLQRSGQQRPHRHHGRHRTRRNGESQHRFGVVRAGHCA